jgi:hypothetical protein
VELEDYAKVQVKRLDDSFGQDRDPVFSAFAVANDYLRVLEVDVFQPKAQGFHEPQSAAIEQLADQVERILELVEQLLNVAARQNDRQSDGLLGANDVLHPRQFDFEHISIEE